MGKKIYSYDKILCKKFGKKITSLRNNNYIKQDEAAFMIGISTSYLSAIERGICDSTITTAKRIAKTYQVNLHELFIFDEIKK